MEITDWILAWFFYPAEFFLLILFINFFAKYCGQSHLLSLKIYIFSHPISLCERVTNCVNMTVHHENSEN